MGRADDGGARVAGEPREQDRDGDRVRAVEPGGRLVGQEHERPGRDRPRDRDARPLALREPRDALGRPLDEPDRLERCERVRPRLVAAAQRERELDVLERRQVRHEAGLLADVGDLLAPQPRARARSSAVRSTPSTVDRAGVRQLEPGEQVEQRRLPGARRAGDRVQPARVELEADVLEDGGRAVAVRQACGRRAPGGPKWCQTPRGCLTPARRRALLAAAFDDDDAVVEARRRLRADPGAKQQLLRQAQPAAAADDDRVRLAVGARPLLRDAAVADADDPVGDARRLGVVADDHRRAAVLAHELAENVVHLVGGRGVELAGRLVGEEDARSVGERGAERDALLLAAGELAGSPVALRGEPDALEQLVGAAQPLLAGRRRAARAAARRAAAR